MVRVVRTDCELETPTIDRTLRARGAELVLLPGNVGSEELAETVRDADLLLTCYTVIDAPTIARARKLKAIIKYGVGIDAIDIGAARAHRIPVVNIPDYAERTVAEAAFALMIALARRLVPIDRAMHRQGWLWPSAEWRAFDISGKTLGLVGAGRIAHCLARMAGAGFGMRVLGFDPHLPADALATAGIEPRTDLTAMIAECDFVSLHCVLNEETRHIIDRKRIAAMRPDAFLVNVSRGALVDEEALLEALREKRIAGAGLDVFSREPLALRDHPLSPLFAMDNVILLPHIAFFTDEAMQRLERETLARCLEALEGRKLRLRSRDPRLRAQLPDGLVEED